MLDFYSSKLSYLHALNCAWIKQLTRDELDLSQELKRAVSSLINARHIWISERNDAEPDSELEDTLPQFAWMELEIENGRAITDLLDRSRYADTISETTWFLLLKQNIEFLGQITYIAKQDGIDQLPQHVFLV